MRKFFYLSLLSLLSLLLATQARANYIAAWLGQDAPGAYVDSTGTQGPLSQIGSPTRPSSPAPPHGTKWLYYSNGDGATGLTATSLVSIDPTNGGLYADVMVAGTPSSGDFALLSISDDPGTYYNSTGFFIHETGGTPSLYLRRNYITCGDLFLGAFTPDVNHSIRVSWHSGTEYVYFDGSLVYTGGCPDIGPLISISIGAGVNPFTCWDTTYVGYVMLSDNYLDDFSYYTVGTSTITPTFSVSPTQSQTWTVSPTSTITPTTSPTSTVTPTPAVVPPLNVRTGELQPNNTIGVFWDANILPSSWRVFLNGRKAADIPRQAVAQPTPGTYFYLLGQLPQGSLVSLTMTALVPGLGESDSSSPITFATSPAPFVYLAPLNLGATEEFTGPRSSSPVSVGGFLTSYSMAVCGVGGSLYFWDMTLQGSLDGTTWVQLINISTAFNECRTEGSGILGPYYYFRVVCNNLNLGTATAARVYIAGI